MCDRIEIISDECEESPFVLKTGKIKSPRGWNECRIRDRPSVIVIFGNVFLEGECAICYE